MKIVSLLPSATEMIVDLGLGANLVGISHACDWPSEIDSLELMAHLLHPAIHKRYTVRGVEKPILKKHPWS